MRKGQLIKASVKSTNGGVCRIRSARKLSIKGAKPASGNSHIQAWYEYDIKTKPGTEIYISVNKD